MPERFLGIDTSNYRTSAAIYNAETGEVWYTDATIPEGDESWSSHKIRYSRNTSASAPDRIINVDIDMYKVRVRKW